MAHLSREYPQLAALAASITTDDGDWLDTRVSDRAEFTAAFIETDWFTESLANAWDDSTLKADMATNFKPGSGATRAERHRDIGAMFTALVDSLAGEAYEALLDEADLVGERMTTDAGNRADMAYAMGGAL